MKRLIFLNFIRHFINRNFENFEFDVFDYLLINNDCRTIVNYIYTALILNQLQCFVVEKILNYIIKFTKKFCKKRNN